MLRARRLAGWAAVLAAAALPGCGGGGINTGGDTGRAPEARTATTAPAPATTAGRTPGTAPATTRPAPRATRVAVAVQDDRLTGPTVPLAEIPARLDLVAATGAKVARFDVLWSDVAPTQPADEADPGDPAYRWARTDATLRGFAERGITPIVSVYSTPGWAADGPDAPPLGPISPRLPDAAAYGRFMTAIARRYSGRVADQSGPLPRVRHWEVWNEPNIGVFLSPQAGEGGARPAMERYVELVRAAGPAIRAASPGSTVIAGVAGPRGTTGDDGTGSLDLLRAVAGDRDAQFDAWSQHLYPAAAPDEPTKAIPSWSTLPDIVAELDRLRPGTPVYVTEAGYTTSPTPYRKVSVTEAEQAERLAAMYRLPLDPAQVPVVVWFNLQDNPAWPAGLLRGDGSRKPSYDAFRAAAAAAATGSALP